MNIKINLITLLRRVVGWGLALAATLAPAERPITVDVYAIPGATTVMIRDLVTQTESPQNHHDIWIVEGGVNDIFTYPATEKLHSVYLESLGIIGTHARACGVKAFFQELTPVIPEIVDPYVTWSSPPYQPKIELLNQTLAQYVSEQHFDLIHVYDELKPHWIAAPGSWCIYQNSDSVHPNALGNRALGWAWAHAIAGYALSLPQKPVRVALFGDSIPAAVHFTVENQPKALLEYYVNNVVPLTLTRFTAD